MKLPTYQAVLKGLRFASVVLNQLPKKEDPPLTWGIRGLAIAHTAHETFYNKGSILNNIKKKHGLLSLQSAFIVNLIFRSKYLDLCEITRHVAGETTDVLEVTTPENKKLVFQEYKLNGLSRDAIFYYDPSFKFSDLMDCIWKEFDNGIYIGYEMIDWLRVMTLLPLPKDTKCLSSKAIERIEHFSKFTKARCYLALGAPGLGKSLFARGVANNRGRRFIKIDSSSVSSLDISEFNLMFDALKPNVIIIDDFDRVQFKEAAGKILFLLENLHQKFGTLTIFTANNISEIDPAFVRAGRVDEIIDFEAPDKEERAWFFKEYLPNISNVENLIEKTEGFSQAELYNLFEAAGERSIDDALKVCVRLHELTKIK